MTTWQDIGTAPRDGTWILAYFNDSEIGYQFIAVVRHTFPNGSGGQYGDFVWETPESRCGYYAEHLATHWMPLPEPPSSPSPPSKEGE
jgi:hypothetical protein